MNYKKRKQLYAKWLSLGEPGQQRLWHEIGFSDNEYGLTFREFKKVHEKYKEKKVEIPLRCIKELKSVNQIMGERNKLSTEIVFNDLHIPFHDPLFVSILLQYIKDNPPDKIKILGDLNDFYAVSHFNKNPNRLVRLQDEINMGKEFLLNLRKVAPAADITWIQGNHERRLIKYLWEHPELSNLDCLTIPSLFELNTESLDINYIETDVQYKYFMFTHGRATSEKELLRCHSAYTAKALLDANGISGISGHSHRGGMFYKTTRSGPMVWVENYCGCGLNPEYIPGVANWQQGFSKVTFINDKLFSIDTMGIVNGILVSGNKVYNGQ